VQLAQREFIRGLHNLGPEHKGCVATIGSFDGVHLGHQVILHQLIQVARSLNVPAVAIVFEPQPTEFFAGDKAPARLMRMREKLEALWAAGIDKVLCLNFNETLRNLSAEQFIDRVLVQGLAIKHLVVGDDFRFGCDRKGDYALLQAKGAELGFEVTDSHTLEIDGKRVSSTRIRHLLEAGNFPEAEKLLGKPYGIYGRVVYGKQLGRQLGVPTANVDLRRYRSPLHGVFAVTAIFTDGTHVQGVANIGVRPTVNGLKKPLLEVHLFNFARDIYGVVIDVVFHHKLRDEKKFASLDELKAQLQTDIKDAKAFFKSDES
jgi:riboflavin kinase / FMN adenylyltransferase